MSDTGGAARFVAGGRAALSSVKEKKGMKKKIGLFVSLALIVVFYLLAVTMPATEVLSPASYVYAGVFLSVIVLLLTQALPDWVVVIGASSLMILTDAVFRKTGLQSEAVFTMSGLFGAFSGSTVWLIIMVFALSAGIGKSGLDRLIAECYDLLGLISFLTAGADECRAWTIRKGTKAPQAAGKIHSDFERGFIRAEIVSFNDLKANGSMTACKEKGLVRSEGKDYVMQDGDVTLFRFNV